MFFLFLNLDKEEKKYRQKISRKPGSKILEDHFACNSDIFHNMDAVCVINIAATVSPILKPQSAVFFFVCFVFVFCFLNQASLNQ